MGGRVNSEDAESAMRKAHLEPLEPYSKSHAPWLCKCMKCGRQVSPSYHAIQRGQGGCAYCAGRKLDPSHILDILREKGLEPLEEFVSTSHKWKCKCLRCGETVYPKFGNLRNGGRGCKNCGYEDRSSKKRNDQSVAISVMMEHGFTPLEPYRGIKYPWKSRCNICQRIVTPAFQNVRKGSRCPYCAKTKVDINEALELLGKRNLEALEPFKGVMIKWKCRCLQCGDTVNPTLNSLKRGQGGCKRCGYLKMSSSQRGDEAKATEIMLASSAQPIEPYKGNKYPWKCRCLKCSRIITPTLNGVRAGQGACVYCAGMKPDIDSIMKKMKDNDLEPLEPYKTALTKWKCKCLKCGAEVNPKYNSIQTGQGGCKNCAIEQNAKAKMLSESEVISVLKLKGYEPLTPYPGGAVKWKMKCLRCQKNFYPTFFNIRSGSGCPSCAKSSYDPNEPGFLYLIEHLSWQMYQVGITNYPDDRLKSHGKLGWTVLEVRGPIDGHLAQDLETSILRMLKANKADLANSEIAGKFDGYSEAWSKSTFKATSLKHLIAKANEIEWNGSNRSEN